MAECAKAFLRNKNRVFLKGDVLTTLARHRTKLQPRHAQAIPSRRMPRAWEAERAVRRTPKPRSEPPGGQILLLCPKTGNAHFWCISFPLKNFPGFAHNTK